MSSDRRTLVGGMVYATRAKLYLSSSSKSAQNIKVILKAPCKTRDKTVPQTVAWSFTFNTLVIEVVFLVVGGHREGTAQSVSNDNILQQPPLFYDSSSASVSGSLIYIFSIRFLSTSSIFSKVPSSVNTISFFSGTWSRSSRQ